MRVIAGRFKGRTLKTPKGSTTRPTSAMLRAAVFNMCQHTILEARFLDLFAGSGAMGIEALSRGANSATFVERDRQALRCIKENLAILDLKARVIEAPVFRATEQLIQEKAHFDLIYVDPPYDLEIDLTSLIPLLEKGGTLFLEERYPPKTRPNISGLKVDDTRRFGEASLTLFSLAS